MSGWLCRCRIELVPEGRGRQPAEALRWTAAQHTEPAREAFEIRWAFGWSKCCRRGHAYRQQGCFLFELVLR